MMERSLLNGTVLGAEFKTIFGQHPGTDGRLSAGLPACLASGVARAGGRSEICPKPPLAQLIHLTFSASVSEISTLCDPMDCSPPGFSVYRILQARILEWVAISFSNIYNSSVQLLSHVQLFATPWTAALQASLSITNSQSLLKLMSIESMMSSNHLILCHPLLLPP